MDFRKKLAKIIAVLDIGTTKIACAIAELDDQKNVRIIGLGHQAARGMRNGIIVDMEALETSILNAVHTAEQAAGETVRQIYVNLAGTRLVSQMVDVEADISGRAVDAHDIRNILLQGQIACQIDNHECIHNLPLHYTIDGNSGILDPRGMVGNQLVARMHAIQAPASPIKNLSMCVNRSHLDIAGYVATPYASALGTLAEDEIELGVTLLDIGGGTTSIAVFAAGHLVFTDVIPLGGDHITNDIARGLSTPLSHAERLKTLYGSVIATPADDREMISVPQVGEHDYTENNQIARSTLIKVIRSRMEEIFEHAKLKLDHSGIYPLAGRRLVLTGGTSQLIGTKDLATHYFEKTVRIARPIPVSGLSDISSTPSFATLVGLLNYAARQGHADHLSSGPKHLRKMLNALLGRMTSWWRPG